MPGIHDVLMESLPEEAESVKLASCRRIHSQLRQDVRRGRAVDSGRTHHRINRRNPMVNRGVAKLVELPKRRDRDR